MNSETTHYNIIEILHARGVSPELDKHSDSSINAFNFSDKHDHGENLSFIRTMTIEETILGKRKSPPHLDKLDSQFEKKCKV